MEKDITQVEVKKRPKTQKRVVFGSFWSFRSSGRRAVGGAEVRTNTVETVVRCLLIRSYGLRKTTRTWLRGVHAPSRRSRYSARRLRRVDERRPCALVSPVHRAPGSRAGRSRVN